MKIPRIALIIGMCLTALAPGVEAMPPPQQPAASDSKKSGKKKKKKPVKKKAGAATSRPGRKQMDRDEFSGIGGAGRSQAPSVRSTGPSHGTQKPKF